MATKKSKKELPFEKIVHIHSKCNAFEFFEQLPEKQALKRLEDIRDGFASLRLSSEKKGRLVVKTCIVNPTLF